MNTLTVDLGTRSYPIYIGQALLGTPELLEKHITGKQVMIVSSSGVPSNACPM